VHAKFWDVREDGSDGRVDYARVIPALRAARYESWLTLEYETPEPEESGIPRALRFLRKMLESQP
jgi:sugar phosphate isomerase/epimerase